MTHKTSDRVVAAMPTFLQAQEFRAQGGAFAHANLSLGLRVAGTFDRGAMQSALEAVVAEHEILRTALAWDGPRVVQKIHSHASVPITTLDLIDTRAGHKSRAWSQFTRAFARAPFRLGEYPALRAAAIRLGSKDHVIGLAVPHTACDLVGLRNLLDDFVNVYADSHSPHHAPAATTPVLQVADLAEWERNSWDRDAEQSWRTFLDGHTARLRLPIDRDGAARYGFFRAFVDVPPVAASCLARLSRVASGLGGTPAAAITAAIAALLGRITGQTNIIVGLMLANRDHANTRSVVGCLIDVLPIPVAVDPDRSFLELVSQVIAAQRSVRARRLAGSYVRSLLDHPCDVVVNLRPRAHEAVERVVRCPPMVIRGFDLKAGEPVFPAREDWFGSQLTISLDVRQGRGLTGEIGYNSVACSSAWTRCLGFMISRTLAQAALRPHRAVREITSHDKVTEPARAS